MVESAVGVEPVSKVAARIEEGTVAPTEPPVLIFDAFDIASNVELTLDWTVAVVVKEGTVTVTIPPTPSVASDVAWDIFSSTGEVEP